MKLNSYKPKNTLEKFGWKVFSLLVENSRKTFYVGGFVRDVLLGRKITDIDLVSDLPPEKLEQRLLAAGLRYSSEFKKFGVLLAKQGKNRLEIATLRADTYQSGRYPKVRFVNSAKIDSARRDFTINALYFQPKTATILDFHGGLLDLRRKRIRFIGRPGKRIQEDPLRIVRALRFAATLNFSLEKKTFSAIKKYFQLVQSVSTSRLEKELAKIGNAARKTMVKKVLQDKKLLDKYFISL